MTFVVDGQTLLLFVYGTLMRQERSHDLLAGARYVGDASTAARYTLVRRRAYPGLIRGGATTVSGELFDVDDTLVAALDAYEGDEFVLGEVDLDDGRTANAYFMRPAIGASLPVISTGNWRRRDEAP